MKLGEKFKSCHFHPPNKKLFQKTNVVVLTLRKDQWSFGGLNKPELGTNCTSDGDK
jgi:hypothetical protein